MSGEVAGSALQQLPEVHGAPPKLLCARPYTGLVLVRSDVMHLWVQLGAPFGSYLERVARSSAAEGSAPAGAAAGGTEPDRAQRGRGAPAKERLQRLQAALARIDALGAQGAEPVDDEAVRAARV